jgi:hypothetical protein
MQGFIILVVISVAILISGCEKEQNHTISTNDGIKVIRNRNQDHSESEKVRLEEIGYMQGYDEIENPDTLSFFNVTDMTFDRDGNSYVFDSYQSNVLKFDKGGKSHQQIIRKGSGPGEIAFYGSCLDMKLDTLVVFDRVATKYFTKNGDLIRSEPSATMVVPKRHYYDDDFNDIYLDISTYFENNMPNQRISAYVKNSKGEITVLPKSAVYPIQEFVSRGIKSLVMAYDKQGIIYLGQQNRDNYTFDLYDLNGRKIMEVTKDYTIRDWPQATLDSYKEIMDNLANRKLHDYFEKMYAYSNLYFDNTNSLLFVEKQCNHEDLTVDLDIFKDGVFLNKVTLDITGPWLTNVTYKGNFYLNKGLMYFYDQASNRIKIYEINPS